MSHRTRTFQLVEMRLGHDLAEHVATLRRDGASWVSISHDLAEHTGTRLTPETIRIWFATDADINARAG